MPRPLIDTNPREVVRVISEDLDRELRTLLKQPPGAHDVLGFPDRFAATLRTLFGTDSKWYEKYKDVELVPVNWTAVSNPNDAWTIHLTENVQRVRKILLELAAVASERDVRPAPAGMGDNSLPVTKITISGGQVQIGDHNVQHATGHVEAQATAPLTESDASAKLLKTAPGDAATTELAQIAPEASKVPSEPARGPLGQETPAGLVMLAWPTLKRHPIALGALIFLLAGVAIAFALASWGQPIKSLLTGSATTAPILPRTPPATSASAPNASPSSTASTEGTAHAASSMSAAALPAARPALRSGAMSDPKRPPNQVFNISGGQVQVGNQNVQNISIAPRAREVPRAAIEQLVNELRSRPSHRYAVVTGFDNDSHGVGMAIFDALKSAGWAPAQFMPGSSNAPPAVNQMMPTPQRRGVTVYVKSGSPEMAAPEVNAFLRWCQQTGLQPGPVGSPSLEQNKPIDLLIEVGDPP